MNAALRRTAVITGASSGFGAATAERLSTEGFDLVLGARRLDRVKEVASRVGGRAFELDVTDPKSVENFRSQVDAAHVLVNNAGLAAGVDRIAELSDANAEVMWETNVLGLLRMTRTFLPLLEASGNGHIVNVGSTAGLEVYPGGGGYTATKHAVRAITQTLRLELVDKPIRVTEVDPGAAETEFSIVRFSGDAERAAKVYEGYEPLTADDVADCIAWAVTRPPHVNVDQIVVRARAQASSTVIHRKS
jgi:NADP-dependent 3-hydroxy acid dehydrogenase YdfG